MIRRCDVDSISRNPSIQDVESTAKCPPNRQSSVDSMSKRQFSLSIKQINRAVINIDKVSTRTISNRSRIDKSFLARDGPPWCYALPALRLARPPADAHVEAALDVEEGVHVEGQLVLGLAVLAREQLDGAEQARHHGLHLQHSVALPDAVPRARAEGHVGVRVASRGPVGQEAIRVELLRLRPVPGIAVRLVDEHGDVETSGQRHRPLPAVRESESLRAWVGYVTRSHVISIKTPEELQNFI